MLKSRREAQDLVYKYFAIPNTTTEIMNSIGNDLMRMAKVAQRMDQSNPEWLPPALGTKEHKSIMRLCKSVCGDNLDAFAMFVVVVNNPAMRRSIDTSLKSIDTSSYAQHNLIGNLQIFRAQMHGEQNGRTRYSGRHIWKSYIDVVQTLEMGNQPTSFYEMEPDAVVEIWHKFGSAVMPEVSNMLSVGVPAQDIKVALINNIDLETMRAAFSQ